MAADAGEPCCAISAIDRAAHRVTARETTTGRTFQFRLPDMRALQALKVGQAIHADFKTMKVSLRPDGASPCCAIVDVRAPAVR